MLHVFLIVTGLIILFGSELAVAPFNAAAYVLGGLIALGGVCLALKPRSW